MEELPQVLILFGHCFINMMESGYVCDPSVVGDEYLLPMHMSMIATFLPRIEELLIILQRLHFLVSSVFKTTQSLYKGQCYNGEVFGTEVTKYH